MMKRKISLVLGSGGARGITQIGVIRLLKERGFEIDEVVGCSIGALIGAALAKDSDEKLGEWMSKLTRREVFRLMDFSDPRFGFLKGDKVLTTLQEVFEDVNIEELNIKYAAVATDLVHEKEVVFRSGSIYSAIRASIAIPAIFKGVNMKDRFLIDGGVLNPVPVNHVQHTDNIIVAVNLDGLPNHQTERSYSRMNAIDILHESYIAMRRRLAFLTMQLHKPDYIIHVPNDISGIWDYDKSMSLIDKGYELASSIIPTKELIKKITLL